MVDDDTVSELLKHLTPLELLRIAPMAEVEHLSSMSDDSWIRNHPDKVVDLGPRRKGVRIIHALMIPWARERPTAA
jgi:hypothetical protein